MVLNPSALEPKFPRKLLRSKTEGKEVQAIKRAELQLKELTLLTA